MVVALKRHGVTLRFGVIGRACCVRDEATMLDDDVDYCDRELASGPWLFWTRQVSFLKLTSRWTLSQDRCAIRCSLSSRQGFVGKDLVPISTPERVAGKKARGGVEQTLVVFHGRVGIVHRLYFLVSSSIHLGSDH